MQMQSCGDGWIMAFMGQPLPAMWALLAHPHAPTVLVVHT